MAVGYWFRTYDLLFSEHDALYGASYTDVNARLLAFRILLVVTIAIALAAAGQPAAARADPAGGGGRRLAAGAGASSAASIPTPVQNFSVKPAELDKERPYILNNIAATRAAFGLDTFTERPPRPATQLSRADVETQPRPGRQHPALGLPPAAADLSASCSRCAPTMSSTAWTSTATRWPAAKQQVMISAREINADGLPDAGAHLAEPAPGLHARLRRGRQPGERDRERRPAALPGARSAARQRGPGPGGDPAADLLRRGRGQLRRGQHERPRSSTIPAGDQRHR